MLRSWLTTTTCGSWLSQLLFYVRYVQSHHSGWQTHRHSSPCLGVRLPELTLFALRGQLFGTMSFPLETLAGWIPSSGYPLMFDVFQSCAFSLRSFGERILSLVLSQHERLDTNLSCMICKHHGFFPLLIIRQYLISFWSDVCSVNTPSFQLNVTHIPKTPIPSRRSGVADGRDG